MSMKKAGSDLGGACGAAGCKADAERMNFCGEHYAQFKFGLIKKNGQLAPDYEKKFEHYNAHRGKQKAH